MSVQDVGTGVLKRVCVAFSTFVGKPVETQKVTNLGLFLILRFSSTASTVKCDDVFQVVLRPVDSQGTAEEQLEHSLASERRRLRLCNEEAFNTLMKSYHILRDNGQFPHPIRLLWLGSWNMQDLLVDVIRFEK